MDLRSDLNKMQDVQLKTDDEGWTECEMLKTEDTYDPSTAHSLRWMVTASCRGCDGILRRSHPKAQPSERFRSIRSVQIDTCPSAFAVGHATNISRTHSARASGPRDTAAARPGRSVGLFFCVPTANTHSRDGSDGHTQGTTVQAITILYMSLLHGP